MIGYDGLPILREAQESPTGNPGLINGGTLALTTGTKLE
jgi:hypothetical protein